MRVDDLIFLVTAAHVVEDVGTGARYFGAVDQVLPLPPFSFKSPLPESGHRDDDPFDIGYWVLDPIQARDIPSGDTLQLYHLDTAQPASVQARAQYYLNGYPSSRQPRRVVDGEFGAKPLNFLTDETASEAYASVGKNRGNHLLVDFDKDDFYSGFQKRIGPDLFGVSGGAIWRLSGSSDVQPTNPRLSAIAVRWRRTVPRCVVGARIRLWIQHAASQFPEQFKREAARLQREQPGR